MGSGAEDFQAGFRKATGYTEKKKKADGSDDDSDSAGQTAKEMMSAAADGVSGAANDAMEMLGFKKKK